MTTREASRFRKIARHSLAIFAAGATVAALNFAGVGSGNPDISSAGVGDRSSSPSRSLPDRLSVQPAITVAQIEEDFLPLATASARLDEAEEHPVCIASPLEPGSFRVSSAYGIRTNPITGARGLHAGVDLAAAMGTPIHAVADGTVVYTGAGKAGRSSELVIIDHEVDGVKFSSWYVHMYPHGVFVKAGQEVRAGEKIAAVGSNGFSTGPHLHLEIHTPVAFSGGKGKAPGRILASPLPALLQPGLDEDTDGTSPSPQESPTSGVTPGSPAEDEGSVPSESTPPDGTPSPEESADLEPPPEPGTDPEDSDTPSEGANPEGDQDPSKDPEGEEQDDADGDSDEDDSEKGTEESTDFEIEEEDDQGENDHVIEDIAEETPDDRSTGIFDPSSLGVLHDPIPFLKALGYGFIAPSSCWVID